MSAIELIKKEKLAGELLEELIDWYNASDEIGKEKLGLGLANAISFSEDLVTPLKVRRAKRLGKEVTLNPGHSSSFSPLDLYATVIAKLQHRKNELVDPESLDYYRNVDLNIRQKYMKCRKVIGEAKLHQRVFIIGKEAGPDLKDVRMFSNYNEGEKHLYASEFGRGHPAKVILTYCPTVDKKPSSNSIKYDNAGISNGYFLPRISNSLVPYIDIVLIKEELELVLSPLSKLLNDPSRNYTTFLTSAIDLEDLPLASIAIVRLDLTPHKDTDRIVNYMNGVVEDSLDLRTEWTKRGNGREAEGKTAGIGNRVAMGAGGESDPVVRTQVVGAYSNFKKKNITQQEVKDLLRRETTLGDYAAAVTAELFPKLFKEEQEMTYSNGETKAGASRRSSWGGVMAGFDANQHLEAANSEEALCTAFGLGQSTRSGPVRKEKKEGDASFILGRLGYGAGVTIEGGKGSVVVWPAKSITHGTGSQWPTNPSERVRGGGHELGFCQTRKTKVGSVFRKEKKRIRDLREGLVSDSKDEQDLSLEFDIGWMGGLTLEED